MRTKAKAESPSNEELLWQLAAPPSPW